MNGGRRSGYGNVVAAIVLGAIVIAAAILASSLVFHTATKTETTTTTLTTTLTTTETTTVFTETSTTTGSSTSISTSNATASTVAYSPESPLQVLGTEAMISPGRNGTTVVTFQVQFKNIGTSSIYYISGCGSDLRTSVSSGTSILRQIPNLILCMCAEFNTELKPGQYSTSVDPGCWSTYAFQLVGHGTVEMNMTLMWSTSPQDWGANTTSIQAEFNL